MNDNFSAPSATSVFQRFFLLSLLAILMLALSPRASAQVDTGQILGTVHDPSGAVVPGADVTLISQDTGAELKGATDSNGTYKFSAIRAGVYTIGVSARGFSSVSQKGVRLDIQQAVVADFTLQTGSVSQIVEVTGAPPPLQTQDASVGGVVEEKTINDLPLNGRNYTFLAQLNSGVTFSQQDSRGLGSSGSFAANGVAANQNNYLLDGVDNNSNLVDFLNGNSYIYKPAVDALEEFKVQTSSFSAEFGRAAGAVLNATIKGGTDRYHGDAWEFFRNSALDAANFFENANGESKGQFQQNQFGATFGGPVPFLHRGRSKTFFFVDYEGTRINQATPYVSTVPTALERSSGYTNLSELLTQGGTQTDDLGRTFQAGQVFDPATTRSVTAGQADPVTGLTATSSGYVRDPFAGNIIPNGRLDTNAINLLNTYPTPTNSNLFNNYTSDPILRDRVDQGDFRADEVLGDKDQIFGRYSRSDEPEFVPGPFNTLANGGGFNTGSQLNIAQNAVGGWTHFFNPTLVNEVRFGYSDVYTQRTQAFSTDYGAPAQFGIQGIPQAPNNGGLPTYTISGLTELGASPWSPTRETNATYQLTENLTKVVGKHSFKGGVEYQHVNITFFQPAYSRGQFDYDGAFTEVPTYTSGNTGLAQLLLTPTASSVGGYNDVGGSDSVVGSNIATPQVSRNSYAFYGQDDWKVTKKLTLNLGLRWEHFGHGVAPNGTSANFLPAFGSQGAELLMPRSTCNAGLLSASVRTALTTDGIALTCSGNAQLLNSDTKDFAPRIGFAYQMFSRLVVRGAYGIFYGSTVNGDDLVDAINYPFSYSLNYPSPDPAHPVTFPNGSTATLENGLSGITFTPAAVSAQGVGFTGSNYNFHTPSAAEYNLSFQYQLSPNQTLTLGYVGTQGRHLQIHTGYNQPEEILVPGTDPQPFVPYPDFARGFTLNGTQANSNYNSMQLTYQRRLSHGLDVLANYTYSKCQTDARDILTNDIGGYRAATLPGFGIQGDWALCDFDVPNS